MSAIDGSIFALDDIQGTEKRLRAIAAEVNENVNIAVDMVCTDETKQSCKNYRAKLKKEFDFYEKERKEKTLAYEAPLKAFKVIYDECIKAPYLMADRALKAKIDAVEDAQKEEKAEAVKEYAEELKISYGLVWLDITRIMPPITLSASEKALKTQVRERIEQINLDCIAAQIDATGEIFAEYQRTLNLAVAQRTVEERRKAIAEAKKDFDEHAKIEEEKIKAAEKIDSLTPPTEEVGENQALETYTMTFTVSGTLPQLKALKAFMMETGIKIINGGKQDG